MQMTIISFSQNTSRALTNSSQIGTIIQKLTDHEVDIINVKDYGLKPCHLCGKCKDSKTCEVDSAFKKLLEDIKHPDVLFFVIPFYAPFPSKLMIFLEKLNEIFYASWLKDQAFIHPLQKASVGLITHGGLVDSPDVVKHYQTMLNIPMVKTLSGLGFKVIVNQEEYPYGLAFGLENEQSIKMTKDNIFPDISHQETYLTKRIEAYVNYVINQVKQ